MQTTHSKIWVKRVLSLILLVITTILFAGCYDLGNFNDTESYYNTFGDVRLINQSVEDNAKDYSFKDYFYNEQSINDFAGSIVSQDEYIYLILPVNSGFNLAEFSIYLKSNSNGVLYYSLFISDFIPEKIRKYDDPKTEEKTDSEGNKQIVDIVYEDLLDEDRIYPEQSINLSMDSWTSFTVKLTTKHSTEINKYHVTNGQNIIVRFENNSGLGKDKGYSKIAFSLTNILIRAL